MKRTALALVLTLLATGTAFAQAKGDAKDAKPTPQQQRMKDCNAQAKDMKGDERKGFMSSCLKGETAQQPGRTAQQNKMASCNKEASAKNMKGDDRRKFMSECLKG